MKAITMLKVLFLTYVFTGLLLLLLSLGLYKLEMTETQVEVATHIVHGLSGLFCGFLAGRAMEKRKFLWGGLAGILYFGILFAVSWLMQQGIETSRPMVALDGLICLCGGILGGMVS